MKRWSTTGMTVLALLGATPALAQDGFRFTSPVDVAIGRDYGFLAHDRKLTDTILVVRPPQVSFTQGSPRGDFTASYQPEIELFDNNRDLNALNHFGSAEFIFRITERLEFTAINDVLVTEDPTRTIDGSLIFLPRQRFTQNTARAAVSYAVTRRNTLTLGFDNVMGGGRVRNAGSVSLAHAFGQRQTMTATYSVLNDRAQFAGVSYRGEAARDLTVNLSTGVLMDGGTNYLVSGGVEKRFGNVAVSGGYDRFFSGFGTSVAGGAPIGADLILPVEISRANTYQVFSAGVSGRLGDRTGIDLGVAVTRNDSGTANRDINNASGRFNLDYGLTDRLKIYTDILVYHQTFDSLIGAPIDRRRYMAGIQFDISSNPNRVSNVAAGTTSTLH